MTQRTTNVTLLSRGGVIRADWLNDVASIAARNAQRLDAIETEVPEGEDGDSAAVDTVFTETSRVTSTVRIEDASDPTVYVDIERIDQIDFEDAASGDTLRLVFNNAP